MRIKLANISGQLEERLPYAECNSKSSLDCPGYSTSESFSVTVPGSPLYATWMNDRIFYGIESLYSSPSTGFSCEGLLFLPSKDL